MRRSLCILLLAALCAAAAPARAEGMPEPRGWAEVMAGQWLADMSLEEKVGQLFMVFFEGPSLSPAGMELLARRHAGGVCLFSRTGNVQDPAQVARLAAEARRMASPLDQGPGLFIAVDQEGGPVARLTKGCTVMPPAMLLGASGDPGNARRAAQITAAELAALGVNVNLAPVLDVNLNPANPVIGARSFGADPEAVARFGLAALKGYEDGGVMPVVKHFPGHGDTAVDSHAALPTLPHSRERLDAVELLPFRRAVAEGAPAVMTAHLAVPALDPLERPATFSPPVLGLLRQAGFDGIIATDSLGMGAVARRMDAPTAALAAFQAGADLLLFGADTNFDPWDQDRAMARVLAAAQAGEISPERLDASVRRILRAKARFGIRGNRGPDPRRAAAACGTPEHRAAARDLAAAGLTLVRPAPGLLPFPPGAPILALWPGGAPDLAELLAVAAPGMQVRLLDADPTPEAIEAAARKAEAAPAVLLLTTRADRHPGQAALGRALPGAKLVVASLAEPYDLALFPHAAGLVAAYGRTPCVLEALAAMLCGAGPAGGRLPVVVPGLAENSPENRNG